MFLRQHWKESANILLLKPSDDTYSVLTVRGNADNNLQNRSYVTPGGTLDSSDFSYKWWLIFDRFRLNSDSLHKNLNGFASSRPPIISDNIMFQELRRSSFEEEYFVPTDVALRIAAIRHLFVQTGILLAEPLNKNSLTPEVCAKWRQSVSQSSENFFKMCDQLDLKPDLYSLKEWWNWLTPSSVGRNTRFDTIYYICCVHNLRDNESEHWSTPQRLMDRTDSDGYFLAPPQVYEFSRLMNFRDIHDLEVFARERQKQGIDRWMPLIALYSDGATSLLPGDDLYPDNVEMIATKPVRTYPQTLEEIRRKSVHLNRMELRGTDCKVVVNIDMPFRHKRPVSYHSYYDRIGAKM